MEEKLNEPKATNEPAKPAKKSKEEPPVERERPSTPILEEETFDDEEYEEETLTLHTKIVDGETIYIDDENNVYDVETTEIIGKYDPKTNTVSDVIEE